MTSNDFEKAMTKYPRVGRPKIGPFPRAKPIVQTADVALEISTATTPLTGIAPHVLLTFKNPNLNRDKNARTANLTPVEARRLAIGLLEAAEKVDGLKST
jgi:hypothetical protein